MKRRQLTHGLAAAWAATALAWAFGAPPRRAGRAAARRCFATRSRSPRPASIRPSSATCIRASSPRTSSTRRSTYDHLARPFKLKPLAAEAHAGDLGRLPHLHLPHQARHLLRRRSGLQGQAARARRRRLRLLVQAHLRPDAKSPAVEPRRRRHHRPAGVARAPRSRTSKPFDYDSQVEGLQALDRYTLRSSAARTAAALLYDLAARDVYGAVAREVVEAYGDDIMAHPVGTGPYRLAQWRRSSLIVLDAQPELPRALLRRRARRRRRRRPGDRARASRAGACR